MDDKLFVDTVSALARAQRQTAVATLAATLVQMRGNHSLQSVNEAVRDATHLLFPDRNGVYQAWAKENGIA